MQLYKYAKKQDDQEVLKNIGHNERYVITNNGFLINIQVKIIDISNYLWNKLSRNCSKCIVNLEKI